MDIIKLRTDSYDPFIDYLKAYSIFCVVFAHCLPLQCHKPILFQLWGGMQVPLFILIQVFHAYKKNTLSHIKYTKIFRRIILPFILTQGIVIGLLCFGSSVDAKTILRNALHGGGVGPGSYYFWIYLQFTFLLPLLFPLVVKNKLKLIGGV